MELEFDEGGTVLVARLSCLGEPGRLQSGKRGWFERSTHLEWRCGWRLCVNWPVTVPGDGYGLPRPEAGKRQWGFAAQENREKSYDFGGLECEGRALTARFWIPDCFEAPFKSFSWGEPILIDGEMFHCALRLELHGPKDGSYLVRRAATRDYAGGIDFMSSRDAVLAAVCDSESVNGRGRFERIVAMLREQQPTGDLVLLSADEMLFLLRVGLDSRPFSNWLKVKPKLAELDEYISRHLSSDCRTEWS